MQRLWSLLGLLGASMFCGILMFSVAVGSIFPKVNAIAGPIVCGNRQLQITQYTASYTPGSVDTTTTDYCVDPTTGTKQEVTPLIVLVAGLIDSLILFAILLVGTWVYRLRAAHSGNMEARAQ
jgi:hypothetical protein